MKRDEGNRHQTATCNPNNTSDEILLNCHDSIEGGHQGIVRTFHKVKTDYYWIGLYADVARHAQTCEGSSTSKSKPTLKEYLPGNIVSKRPFRVVSMDFVIPILKTRRGNTALLLFQDPFTEFVDSKSHERHVGIEGSSKSV